MTWCTRPPMNHSIRTGKQVAAEMYRSWNANTARMLPRQSQSTSRTQRNVVGAQPQTQAERRLNMATNTSSASNAHMAGHQSQALLVSFLVIWPRPVCLMQICGPLDDHGWRVTRPILKRPCRRVTRGSQESHERVLQVAKRYMDVRQVAKCYVRSDSY